MLKPTVPNGANNNVNTHYSNPQSQSSINNVNKQQPNTLSIPHNTPNLYSFSNSSQGSSGNTSPEGRSGDTSPGGSDISSLDTSPKKSSPPLSPKKGSSTPSNYVHPSPCPTSTPVVGILARDVNIPAHILAQWKKENELVKKLEKPGSCFGLSKFQVQELFADHVNEWAQNGTQGENRTEAARRIIAAYQSDALFLDLDGLKLGSLPPIAHWTKIRSWRLSNNQLHDFPASFLVQRSLKDPYHEMDLRNNVLNVLPEKFKWNNLIRLDAGFNKLNTLPDDTIYIYWIDADYNEISSISSDYQALEYDRFRFHGENITPQTFSFDHPVWCQDPNRQYQINTSSTYHLNLIGNQLSTKAINTIDKDIPELFIDRID